MKYWIWKFMTLATILGLIGCTVPSNEPAAIVPASGTVLKSDMARDSNPGYVASDLEALVNGNTAFATDLYQALKVQDGNMFYSPYSISLALAMTYAGARGKTEQQMAETLNFTLPQDALHPALNGLDLALASRGEGAEGKDGEPFKLHIVNALWGQQDYEFSSAFLDTLGENYGAGLRILNFAQDPEAARLTINDWAAQETENRIEDLIRKGLITQNTVLVLGNAIYFNAAWMHPFNEEMTQDKMFHLLDGSTVDVPMMQITESFGYAQGKGYQAVELPHSGHELSMVVIVPDEGQFETFEQEMDSIKLNQILGDLKPEEVALSLPKFEMTNDFELRETLISMGMVDAFGGSADFSGMDGTKELFIGNVVHKAFVSVDEAGTEAAAATAVIMLRKGVAMNPKTVNVDRPFVFVIRDMETNAVLFVGRVVNPAE